MVYWLNARNTSIIFKFLIYMQYVQSRFFFLFVCIFFSPWALEYQFISKHLLYWPEYLSKNHYGFAENKSAFHWNYWAFTNSVDPAKRSYFLLWEYLDIIWRYSKTCPNSFSRMDSAPGYDIINILLMTNSKTNFIFYWPIHFV